MKKRLVGAISAVLLCAVLLCGCGKEPETEKLGNNDPNNLLSPAMVLTSATANAGDEITLDLSITESSDLWGFSWEVHYDGAVLTPVDVVMSEAYNANFEMEVTKDKNPVVLQGVGREIQNYPLVGDVAQLTFRVAKNAAPGEYPVNIGCKEGNNIDVDANDIPFTPVTAIVTVK